MVQVERATASDAEEILALQKLAYQSEAEIYEDDTIPPLVQTLEEMEKDFERQTFFKAAAEGRIVGSVRGFEKGGTCYVGRLLVHPAFQNRGIGRELMVRIQEAFGKSARFELFTGHRSEKNLSFYEKLGYKRFRTEKVHDRLTIVFMEKLRPDGRGKTAPP